MNVGWQRTIWVFWMLVALALWPGAAWSGEHRSLLNTIEEEIATILEDNRSSVVRIHTLYSHPENEAGLGTGFMHGTGFVFDPRGYILTVEEAVREAEEIRVTLASGLQVRAVFIASDPASEVAVIQAAVDSLPAATLGNSDRVRIGHYAFILGNTFGNLTPSFGSVHEINQGQDLIHITAPVHPSYGGAPVFCSTGEVVGMVWARVDPWAALRQSGLQEGGVGAALELPTTVFVVPISRAIRIARRLIAEQEVAYGWLGVEGEFDPKQGFQVTSVSPQGPAAASGIRPGDLILSYQGMQILNAEHLRNLVLSTLPGTPVQMKLKRGSTPITPRVEVGRVSAGGLTGADLSGAFPAGVSFPPLGMGQRREVLFEEIDRLQQEQNRLEQELWRLRQQLLQKR